MIRVRNEAEFLEAAVRSIADLVDRILLVDNLSTDSTPDIIKRLAAAYPDKVNPQRYPFEVTRVGRENWDLAERGATENSLHLLADYYNWCLDHCQTGFVLKWDGDMIALPALGENIAAWRNAQRPVLFMQGANVHPDRHHLIRARITDREALLTKLERPGMPRWVTSLTYDFMEPRLFPRKDASYDTRIGWTQVLSSPFTGEDNLPYRASVPCFLHMKFCKRDPLTNYSPDLAAVIADNVDIGPDLPSEWRRVLNTYGHG